MRVSSSKHPHIPVFFFSSGVLLFHTSPHSPTDIIEPNVTMCGRMESGNQFGNQCYNVVIYFNAITARMITQLFSGLFRLDLGYILHTSPHHCNFFLIKTTNY